MADNMIVYFINYLLTKNKEVKCQTIKKIRAAREINPKACRMTKTKADLKDPVNHRLVPGNPVPDLVLLPVTRETAEVINNGSCLRKKCLKNLSTFFIYQYQFQN